jgi:hypothetical protein
MAKVTSPLFSSEARGRVGGVVYNTWRGLATAKCKIAPAQPRTARQLAVRAYLTTLSKAWKSQSDANRALWNLYAVDHPRTDWSGSSVRSTGLNWFLALNSRRLDQGLALVATPPIVDGPANVAAPVLTGGVGTLSLAFTAYGGTATQIEAYLYGPRSAGVIPRFTKAKFKSRGPGETTPFVITALGAGLYTVWYRAVSETDGQASAFIELSATVT